MPLPTPPVALKDHCSIIYQNTLYTYQADAFQSLPLKDGAEWSKLSMGVSTNGSTCVQGKANGEDVLFIVGGSTNSSNDYSGLQRYTFEDKSWETCKPQTNVTQNRLLHGSTFLASSSSILMYGGSQDSETTPSSQTFVISTDPPYAVRAFNSKAPPVVNPLVLPWNESHAVILGGDSQNREIFTFGPDSEWNQLNVSLRAGLPDSRKVQAAIITADDGGKALQLFDMSVSPNDIQTVLLQNATRSAISQQSSQTSSRTTASTVSTSSLDSVLPKVTIVHSLRAKRATSLEERPPYDVALAPKDTRQGFSLAQGSDGLVVTSGGNDQDVLTIFNETSNQWVDTSRLFGDSEPTVLDVTPTPSSTSPAASITAQPSTSSSPPVAPPNRDGTKNKSLTILGATLGAVFGLAALLVLLLFLLRYLRRKRENKRRGSDFPLHNKHDMDFADQGADYMREAGGSFGNPDSKHHHNISGNSATSVTIMGGKRNSSQQSKRALFHRKGNSDGSAKSYFGRSKSPVAPSPPLISEPILASYPGQSANPPRSSPSPRTEPRTDTGWSKYWNNSSSNINAVAASAPQQHGSNSRPTTYTSTSDYESSRVTSSNPHESAEVEPLSIRASQLPPNTRLVSPTSGMPLQTGNALSSGAHVPAEPPTPTTLVSDIDEEDEYRLHVSREPEGTSSWTPIEPSDRGSTWTDRPVSSVYADSMKYPHPGERVRIPNFPGVPSRRPSNRQNTRPLVRQNSQGSNRGMRSAAAKDFASTLPPSRTPDPPNTRRVVPGHGAYETRTFPRRPDELGPRGPGGRDTEDMSWLNLGTSK